MLTGIAFLLVLVGVIVVVIWEITNDAVGLTEETWGLLRMQKERLTAGKEQETKKEHFLP